MKSCATYNSDGVMINDCQKVNFIYGANGSGKSTISNYLQNQEDPQYFDCEISWENNTSVDIVVYNREFRNRNFKENIKGVFTLGQAAIEEIEALEEMKAQRENKRADFESKTNSLNQKKEEEIKHSNDFRDKIWNVILKQNENDFQEAFSRYRGNKEKFKEQVISRYKVNHTSSETKENLISRAKTLLANKPECCDLFSFSIENLINEITIIENDTIWSKVVVGNKDIPIAKLIDLLNNADWVNSGRYFIKGDEICPFCQQKTITADLAKQLDDFFSGEYEKDIAYIKIQIGKYKTAADEMISNAKSLLIDDNKVKISGMDVEKYNAIISVLTAAFSSNLKEMQNKEKEAGKEVAIAGNLSNLNEIKEIAKCANESIKKHNVMVNNYNDERDLLIDDIWTFLLDEQEALVSGYLKGIENFEKAKKGIQQSIDSCRSELEVLDDKIVEAGKNITSVQPTVDEINRSLKAYGFTNFQIAPSESQANAYQIQRPDGTLATNTLSEGEETFISFLYFLQLAKGSVDISKISARKILVLDDPICSLDSTILYIVSSMAKNLTKNVRKGETDVTQIFILTHNVFFHKEAAFIDRRTQVCNDINYWIINKDQDVSSITSYGKDNPIKTSYELLWQEMKSNANSSLVTTQNVMRRILENYFSILGKTKDDEIVDSFTTIEDKMICRSLLSWINDGSHSIPDDLYFDSYTDSIDRYKQIFKEVFIKMEHEAHYNMMMQIKTS